MKGISTILAVILIVIIVVAMISLTYTFAANLITTTTTGATQQTTTTAERMLKSVNFVSAFCTFNCSGTDNDCIKFTLRHTGSVDIKSGELAAFLDGSKITTTPLLNETSLSAGRISDEFGYNTTTNDHKTSRKIIVSAPAGEIDKIVTCE